MKASILFLPVVFLLASPQPAEAQTLPFPGSWAGSADWRDDGSIALDWAIGAPSQAKTATLSTTVTGPGTLAISYSCSTYAPPSPVFAEAYLRVQTGAATRSFSPGVPWAGAISDSVPLAAGPQTVTLTLYGNPGPSSGITNWQLSASLHQLSVVPPLTLSSALDTTLDVTGSGWLPVQSGNNDFARLSFGQSNGIGVTVTGPAVVSIKAGIEGAGTGPSGQLNDLGLDYSGPGVSGLRLATFNIPMDQDLTWGFSVPAGTHTLSWSGLSGYTFFGDGITWTLDNLKVQTPADFAAALESNLTWQWSGDPPNTPFCVTDSTHDGTDAVRLPRTRGGNAVNATLTTSLTTEQPALLSFWWKASSASGSLRMLRNGSALSLPHPGTAWTQHYVRLPAGTSALQWESAPPGGLTSTDGWLDEVKMASAFETWLAAFLTDSQLAEPQSLAPQSDRDGDGLPALMEYALQSSPTAASGDLAPVFSADPANPGSWLLKWKEPASMSGASLIAEASADLNGWQPLTKIQTGTAGGYLLMQARLPTQSPALRFARLKAQVQP